VFTSLLSGEYFTTELNSINWLYRSLTDIDLCPQSITVSTELHTPNTKHKVFSSPPDSRRELPLNWLCPLLITSQHGPRRNTPFPLLHWRVYSGCVATVPARNTENTALPCCGRHLANDRCLQSHRLATGLYTITYLANLHPSRDPLVGGCVGSKAGKEAVTKRKHSCPCWE
jgi:hypothetical protein